MRGSGPIRSSTHRPRRGEVLQWHVKKTRRPGVLPLAPAAASAASRLATLVRDSNDAVIVRDLNDRIISWNRGARKMYGYTEAQALGMSLCRLMPRNRLLRAKDLLRVS